MRDVPVDGLVASIVAVSVVTLALPYFVFFFFFLPDCQCGIYICTEQDCIDLTSACYFPVFLHEIAAPTPGEKVTASSTRPLHGRYIGHIKGRPILLSVE